MNQERLRGWAYGVLKSVEWGFMRRGGVHHLEALRVLGRQDNDEDGERFDGQG